MVYQVQLYEVNSGRVLQIRQETERLGIVAPQFLGALVFRSSTYEAIRGGVTASGLVVPSAGELMQLEFGTTFPLYGEGVASHASDDVDDFVHAVVDLGNDVREQGFDKVQPIPLRKFTPEQTAVMDRIAQGLSKPRVKPRAGDELLRTGNYL